MTTNKYLDSAGLTYYHGKVLNAISSAVTPVSSAVTSVSDRVTALEALIASDADGTINKFNEILAFLAGIPDSGDTLNTIISRIGDLSHLSPGITDINLVAAINSVKAAIPSSVGVESVTLTEGDGITIASSTGDSASNLKKKIRVKYGVGLMVSANNDLEVNVGDGLGKSVFMPGGKIFVALSKQKSDSTNVSGLEIIGDSSAIPVTPGLSVKVKDLGGITKDADGLSINTANGLRVTSGNAIAIKTDNYAGIKVDSDGIGVKLVYNKANPATPKSGLTFATDSGSGASGHTAGLMIQTGDGVYIGDSGELKVSLNSSYLTVGSNGIEPVTTYAALSTSEIDTAIAAVQ